MNVVILFFLFVLAGCGSNQGLAEIEFQPNEFKKADFALYDPKSQSMISMGMDREEVEKHFGKHVDTIDFLGIYEYEGVKVHYKDNKVNAIIIDDNTDSNERLQTTRSARYGSAYLEVLEKYGDSGIIEETDDNFSLTYIVEYSDGEYVIRKSRAEIKNKEHVVTISANFYEKDKMSFLMIADYFHSYPEK
jgi:hypothetical protein